MVRLQRPKLRNSFLFLSPFLLIIFWYNFSLLGKVDAFFNRAYIDLQLEQAALLATHLDGKSDLLLQHLDEKATMAKFPIRLLTSEIRIDGRVEDWKNQIKNIEFFGISKISPSFEAMLGEYDNKLHLIVRVIDSSFQLLSSSDKTTQPAQIHLYLLDDKKQWITIAVRPKKSPTVRFKYSDQLSITKNDPAGEIRLTQSGYVLEASLPEGIATNNSEIGIVVVNAASDSDVSSYVPPVSDLNGFYLPLIPSVRLQELLTKESILADRNYLVLDSKLRIRARSFSQKKIALKGLKPDRNPWHIRQIKKIVFFIQKIILKVTDEVYELDYQQAISVLAEQAFIPPASRVSLLAILPNNNRVILVAQPLINDQNTFGLVVTSTNLTQQIPSLTNLPDIIFLISGLTLIGVFFLGLLVITLMANRISRLGEGIRRSIDRHGRLKEGYLHREVDSGDEIGELARDVSNILLRLHQHNQFLENMPGTLRHEINNPLNVVSTSLQNLAEENAAADTSKYMESAKRGVASIGSIVQYLSDAVSLEESLKSEDKETINIGLLLENYITNCRILHKDISFDYQGHHQPVYARVSDYRIEQLMDKLIDNAVDFHQIGTRIQVHLTTFREELKIIVSNYGATLPEELGEEGLFDSMVTDRKTGQDSKLHFGLGLYVVRVIAEHHGGSVTAKNLADLGGVQITVSLPRPSTHAIFKAKKHSD